MPRHYKRKTERGSTPEGKFQQAANLVNEHNMSIRVAAEQFGINRMTLARYLKTKRAGYKYDRTAAAHRVFTDEQEAKLAKHITALADCFHGLTPSNCQKFAFDFATANKLQTPPSWLKNEMAGCDWLSGFMKRRKLSICQPEATSIARQTAFNKPAIENFFKSLSDLMARHRFAANAIYNLDETGMTTVQNPGKVVTELGVKQVGSITSQERGELVTLCCAVNAAGNHLPPFYIFPRVFMKESFLNHAAPGAKGVACKSGYMNADIFAQDYLPFFIQNTRCSVENPVLLILDNHSSHCSYPVVALCKQSGIHLLTLPPHTSHKTQPLDICVFGVLKTYWHRTLDEWMRSNPGRSISIYEIAGLSARPFTLSMSPENILSGFRCTGILPLDSAIFKDHEFAAAMVTDQPLPAADNNVPDSIAVASNFTETRDEIVETPQVSMQHDVPVLQITDAITPEQVLPLPKAGPRKPSNRRKVKSTILTDTPEKDRLQREYEDKEKGKKSKPIQKKKRKQKNQIVDSSTDGEGDIGEPIVESDSESGGDMETMRQEDNYDDIEVDSYVLVKYETERQSLKYYMGKVDLKEGDVLHIRFMRQIKEASACPSFCFPNQEDTDTVAVSDIILILGQLKTIVGTKRSSRKIVFDVDLSGFVIE